EDYQKNVELRNKILNELNARRRDRIDQLRRAGSTFIDIVKSLKDQENKDKYGKYMELLRLAKEAKKSEWRQPKLLQDGSKDCLLLEEHSNIDGSDGYNKSILLSDALKAKKKWEILVIDDDNSRKQIFSDILQGHKISFVSNSYEANGLIMSKQ